MHRHLVNYLFKYILNGFIRILIPSAILLDNFFGSKLKASYFALQNGAKVKIHKIGAVSKSSETDCVINPTRVEI